MKVVYLGVGEACDERLPNTSIWIVTKTDDLMRSVLLDCGFTVPSLYWRHASDQEDLDALWVSHFHGDHFFGIPALLLRMHEMRRRKPLIIIGQPAVDLIIRKAIDLAYPNLLKKLSYPVEFLEAKPGEVIHAAGLTWKCAENGHTQRNLALRIEDGKHSVFYSGDGPPTQESIELARGCDLIIHEAFRLDQAKVGHCTVVGCIDFAREAGVSLLALVHLERTERRERYRDILTLVQQYPDLNILLPEPGDETRF